MTGMRIKNTATQYGLVAVALHWLIALAVLGQFALGLWIAGLEYYDPWYQRGPALHKGIGILVLIVVALRLAWRWMNPVPAAQPTHAVWERRLARITHAALYVLLLATLLAGYLIARVRKTFEGPYDSGMIRHRLLERAADPYGRVFCN